MKKFTYKTKRRERERERTTLKPRLAKWSMNNNTENNWLRTEFFGGIL